MYEAKTRPGAEDVREYLAALEPAGRRADALKLLDIFAKETGLPAVLWGGSMVGFGAYRYRYKSGHAGEAFRSGFAMRKGTIVLYLLTGGAASAGVLPRLGPHKTGVSCVYVKRLADVDETALRELIRASMEEMDALYPDGREG